MMLLPRVLPGTKQARMDSNFFFQQNDVQRKVFMKFPYSWCPSDEQNLDLSCLKFYLLLTAAWSSTSCSPVPGKETTGTSSVLLQIKLWLSMALQLSKSCQPSYRQNPIPLCKEKTSISFSFHIGESKESRNIFYNLITTSSNSRVKPKYPGYRKSFYIY